MKRRLLALTLAAGMALSLTACGSSSSDDTETTAATEAETEAATEAETEAAVETEEETEAETATVVVATDDDGETTILYSYLNGDSTTGLMARMWFPDAGAGYDADGDGLGDELDLVEEMILDMCEAGFGGCEITMLLDSTDYAMLTDEQYEELGFEDSQDAIAALGWGTESWANILACALDTANEYNAENGTDFTVDVTITAHWPMIINTIDPNDDAQQQQLVYTIQKISAEDLENGVELTLPEMKTEDVANSDSMVSTFIFTDTLVSSTLVRYDEISEVTTTDAWSGEEVTSTVEYLDYESFVDLTDYVTAEDAYAAGVPYADATYMKLIENEDGTYTWETYDSISEVDASLSDVEDYIVLEAGTEILMDGTFTVTATVGSWSTTYEVVNTETGETLEDGTYDLISPGSIVSYYEDEDGNTCATTCTTENTEALDGVITITNRDFLGDRDEMDDTQEVYTLSAEGLSSSLSEEAAAQIATQIADSDIEEGDYVLVNVYTRGTGQVASGGGNIPMTNKTYAVDYFSEAGAQAVIDYWEENLLPYEYTRTDGTTITLAELFETNGGSIFEDSIELSHEDGNLWSVDLLDSIEEVTGLDARLYMPIIAGLSVQNEYSEEADRITEDYKETLNQTYSEYHLGTISEWTSTFGCTFRTQSHGIDAVDAGTAALSTDIAESDNATDGFGTRAYAGAKNINPDNNVISNESLTFGTGFGEFPSWYYAINTLNRYFSEGVNRVILHGTSFKTSYTLTSTADSSWPGWDFMSFMSWNSRQTWWDEVEVFSDYINRVQSVLQLGTSKIPVAILEDPTVSNVTQINSGVGLSKSSLQELIGEGYNYNIITRGMLESDDADLEITTDSLSGNVVLSTEAEFQVLVLDHITCMSVEAMEKLLSYAEAGLLIVNVGSDITTIYGTDEDGTGDATVQELWAQIQACDSYYEITSDDTTETDEDGMTQAEIDMIAYISENVNSGVSYSNATSTATNDAGSKWLETTRIYDETDGTNYYLIYNESGVSVGAEQDSSFGPAYWEENGDISVTITLEGNGVPYLLDPADGSVTAIADYTVNDDGSVTFDLEIEEGDLIFVAMSDSDEFVEAAVEQVTDTTTQDTVDLGGDTVWTLSLNSYSADESEDNLDEDGNMYDPTQSEITTIELSTTLVTWDSLSLTDEQLETLGVASAAAISGTGDYSIEIEVPDYGTETVGAILYYDYDVAVNNITKITVTNADGEETVLTGINPNHNYLDLGTVLTSGTNTITIRVCGDLTNRINNSDTASSLNGLTDASIEFYTVD